MADLPGRRVGPATFPDVPGRSTGGSNEDHVSENKEEGTDPIRNSLEESILQKHVLGGMVPLQTPEAPF